MKLTLKSSILMAFFAISITTFSCIKSETAAPDSPASASKISGSGLSNPCYATICHNGTIKTLKGQRSKDGWSCIFKLPGGATYACADASGQPVCCQ